MARFMAGVVAAQPTALLPNISVYSAAATGFKLIEAAAWFSGGITGGTKGVRRLTTLGTPGSTLTAAKYDPDGPASVCTAYGPHSVGPTLSDWVAKWTPQVIAGAGQIRTVGVSCPVGTTNGLGLLTTSGSSTQDAYMVWEEP